MLATCGSLRCERLSCGPARVVVMPSFSLLKITMADCDGPRGGHDYDEVQVRKEWGAIAGLGRGRK